MATLCERAEDDGFERRDYALDVWEAQGPPDDVFSYWKTTVPDPEGRQNILVDDAVLWDLFEALADDTRRNILVDDAVLWDLFEALADDTRRRRQAYRFILALILMRKKLLKYVGRTGQGEDERWLMRPKGAGPEPPPLEVIDPHLTDEDVRELTEQLSEVLQSEL
jgi:hypothetical protein